MWADVVRCKEMWADVGRCVVGVEAHLLAGERSLHGRVECGRRRDRVGEHPVKVDVEGGRDGERPADIESGRRREAGHEGVRERWRHRPPVVGRVPAQPKIPQAHFLNRLRRWRRWTVVFFLLRLRLALFIISFSPVVNSDTQFLLEIVSMRLSHSGLLRLALFLIERLASQFSSKNISTIIEI